MTWTIRDNHTSYYLRLCARAVDPNLGSTGSQNLYYAQWEGSTEHGQTFIGLKKVGGHCARVKKY